MTEWLLFLADVHVEGRSTTACQSVTNVLKSPGPSCKKCIVKGFLNLRDILQTFTGLHVLVKYLDSETYNHIKLKWFGNGKTILFHVDLSSFNSICAVGYHRNEFDMKDKYEKVFIYVFPTVHLLKPRQACSKMNKYLKG